MVDDLATMANERNKGLKPTARAPAPAPSEEEEEEFIPLLAHASLPRRRWRKHAAARLPTRATTIIRSAACRVFVSKKVCVFSILSNPIFPQNQIFLKLYRLK